MIYNNKQTNIYYIYDKNFKPSKLLIENPTTAPAPGSWPSRPAFGPHVRRRYQFQWPRAVATGGSAQRSANRSRRACAVDERRYLFETGRHSG